MADPKARIILEAKRKGQGAFRSFEADLGALGRKAAVIGAAAAAALALVTRESLKSIDALAKTSDKLGITTEKLAGLQLAANITGIETSKLEMGLQRMTRRIGEIATFGRGEAIPALQELGISIEDIADLSPDEQFNMLASAMGNVESQSKRVAIGFKLFDSEGVDLINTLALGEEGLQAWQTEAERLGLAINRIDAAKVEQANDAILVAKRSMEGIGNVIAVQVAPILTALAEQFAESTGDAEEMGQRVNSVLNAIAVSVGMVGDAFQGWQLIFAAVRESVANLRVELVELADDTFRSKIVEFGAALAGQNVAFQASTVAAKASEDAIREAQVAAQLYMAELANAPKFSDQLLDGLEAARARAQEIAEAAAGARGNTSGGGGETAQTPEQIRAEAELKTVTDMLASREDLERDALERRVQIARTAFEQRLIDETRFQEIKVGLEEQTSERLMQIASERLVAGQTYTRQQIEQEIERFDLTVEARIARESEELQRQLEFQRIGLEMGILTDEEFAARKIALEEQTQAEITRITLDGVSEREKFEIMSAKAKTKHVLGELQAMTAGVATHNKAMFQINKAAAIGNAVMNTAESVTRALKDFPVPVNFAMAALNAAAGLAQIQAIKSASFGGGTTPSVAGSAPTVNGNPVQSTLPSLANRDEARGNTRVEIHIQGSVIGQGGAEQLKGYIVDSLRDEIDRDEVVISKRTAQGQALV